VGQRSTAATNVLPSGYDWRLVEIIGLRPGEFMSFSYIGRDEKSNRIEGYSIGYPKTVAAVVVKAEPNSAPSLTTAHGEGDLRPTSSGSRIASRTGRSSRWSFATTARSRSAKPLTAEQVEALTIVSQQHYRIHSNNAATFLGREWRQRIYVARHHRLC